MFDSDMLVDMATSNIMSNETFDQQDVRIHENVHVV